MARTALISGENLQTILAVTFVLALLAVAFNFYNFTRNQQTYFMAVNANNINVQGIEEAIKENKEANATIILRLDAIDDRLSAMDARISALDRPE